MNQSARRVRARSDSLGTLEVRRGRAGVRLMAHGVLYSIDPAAAAATPAPWLVLGAAPWMTGQGRRRGPLRVGILGFGGGTVARLVRGFDREAEIIGVEPDREMRRIAAREMGVRALGATIVPTGAAAYLSPRGPRFDALIDDVFAPRRGRLARPDDGRELPRLALGRLRPGGVYAVNLAAPGGPVERATVGQIRAVFPCVMVVYLREYAHKIVLASDHPFERGSLRRALRLILLSPGAQLADLGIGRVMRYPAGAGRSAVGPDRPVPGESGQARPDRRGRRVSL